MFFPGIPTVFDRSRAQSNVVSATATENLDGFVKKKFRLHIVAYRNNIPKISRVPMKSSGVQSPSMTMTCGNGKMAELYTGVTFGLLLIVQRDSEDAKGIRMV
jgi:hypothetical protein